VNCSDIRVLHCERWNGQRCLEMRGRFAKSLGAGKLAQPTCEGSSLRFSSPLLHADWLLEGVPNNFVGYHTHQCTTLPQLLHPDACLAAVYRPTAKLYPIVQVVISYLGI